MTSRTRGSSEDLGGAQVVFWVAGRLLAIPITAVREVVEVKDVVAVPDVAAFVIGVTSLRGAILPVVDTERLLFDKSSSTPAAKMLVLVRGEVVLSGLTVDRVHGVVPVRRSTLLADGELAPERFVAETHDLGLEGLVSVVDLPALLAHLDSHRNVSNLAEAL